MSFFHFIASFCPLTCPPLLLAILQIGSATSFRYFRHSAFAFHLSIGLLLFFAPWTIFGRTINGRFDVVHTLQQRFLAPYHLGFAVFHFLSLSEQSAIEPIFRVSKAVTSTLSVFIQLMTAYKLHDSQTRGIQTTANFFTCVILIDGISQLVEKIHLLTHWRRIIKGHRGRSVVSSDEIDLLVKRTHRLAEDSRICLYTNLAFWLNSVVYIAIAFFNFVYAGQILKIFTRREFVIDDLHIMYLQLFAAQYMGLSILSFCAIYTVSIERQNNIFLQLITMQGTNLALNIYGHFISGVYNARHIVPFLVWFFLFAAQGILGKCIKNETNLDGVSGGTKREAQITLRKTVSRPGS